MYIYIIFTCIFCRYVCLDACLISICKYILWKFGAEMVRTFLAEMVQDSKATTWGGVSGCKIEARCKAREQWEPTACRRSSSLREKDVARSGVSFKNMRPSWVMKWGAQQGLSVVASIEQWLGAGKAKVQRRGVVLGAITAINAMFFQNLLMYLGFLSR